MSRNCPECNGVVQFSDARQGHCPHCETRICIPNRYYLTPSIGACIFTLFVVKITGSLVWTSPAVFSYVMLWLVFFVFCDLQCCVVRVHLGVVALLSAASRASTCQ